MVIKKAKVIGLLLFTLVFTGCFSIPGYVHNDGSINPPYSKEILIESIKGNLMILPMETSKGQTNVNPSKSDMLKSRKQNTIFLTAYNSYYYTLEGNHSVVLSFRTFEEEAILRIVYRDWETECVIHSSDPGDKMIYLENY